MKLLHCLLAATLATTWCVAFPQDVSPPPIFSDFGVPLSFPDLASRWQGYQRTGGFGISPINELSYSALSEFEYPPVNGFNGFVELPEANVKSLNLQERKLQDEVNPELSPESINAQNTEGAVQVNSENILNPFGAPQYSRIPETISDFPNHNFNNFPVPYAPEYMEFLGSRTPRFPLSYIPEFPVPVSPPSPIIQNFPVGIPEHLTPKQFQLNNIPGFQVPNTHEFQFDAVQRFPANKMDEFSQLVPSNAPEFPFWNLPRFPNVPVVHASAFGLSLPKNPEFAIPNVPDFTLPQEPGFPFANTPGINSMDIPEVSAPRIPEFLVPNVPDFNLPNSPEFSVPNVPSFEIPNSPEIRSPIIPEFMVSHGTEFDVRNMPETMVPAVPNFAVPNVPDFNGPSVPNFAFPNIPDFANFAVPNAHDFTGEVFSNFAVPNAPDFNGPPVPNFVGEESKPLEQLLLDLELQKTHNAPRSPLVVPFTFNSFDTNSEAVPINPFVNNNNQLPPTAINPFMIKSQSRNPFMINSQSPELFMVNNQSPNPFMTNDQSPNAFMTNNQSPDLFMANNQSPDLFMTNNQSPNDFMTNNYSPNTFTTNNQSPQILDTFAPPINPFVFLKMQGFSPVYGGPQIFNSMPFQLQAANGYETDHSEPQLSNGPVHGNDIVNPHASEASDARGLHHAVTGRVIDVSNQEMFNEETEKFQDYNPVPVTSPFTQMDVVQGPHDRLDFDGSYNALDQPVPFFY